MRRWWVVAAAVVVVVAAAVVVVALTRRHPGPAPIVAASPSSGPPSSALPSASPAPSRTPQDVNACVAATVAGLSLAQRSGQLLMIGTPVADPASLARTVAARHLGGVFLAGRSRRPAAALRQDIAALQRSAPAVPLLVALDQEGGAVQTLHGSGFPPVPSASVQGGWSAATLRARTAAEAGRLAAIGVTQNLAPVADTVPRGLGTANPPIGAFHRQFGSEPGAVAAAIRTVVPASQRAGVLTTLKHFPGLGRVRVNTDTSTGSVDPATTATDPDLKPFAAGIRAGSAAVMVSSASYPRLDRRAIAAFSEPIITGLLRGRLGFSGMVMSDDLGAAGAVAALPVGQRAVRFIGAGGDLVLTIRPEDAGPMADAVVAEARQSPAFAARVADAAGHVIRAKYRAGLLRCS
jgi:beta-N-acetylhexosaminidase